MVGGVVVHHSTGRVTGMKRTRKELGQQGESLAVRYLAEQGYEILERNWRCARGELDIIAERGEWLVFVEVRTRTGQACGSPEESITPAKRSRLLELAQTYLQQAGWPDRKWRVDVIALLLDRHGRLERLNHIESAVEA
jgi:putative endonuclease